MILSFQDYLTEALKLKETPEAREHYLDRTKVRLANLRVIGIKSEKGEEIDVSNQEMLAIQEFFRKTLSSLADPATSNIFKEVSIDKPYGIIRLGTTKVILKNGQIGRPVFEVYEKTDEVTGKIKLRVGTCFWIFTHGNFATTIKLYNVDGNKDSEKDFLISKSIDHHTGKQGEASKIEQKYGISILDREALANLHQIVITPAGISKIVLDLNSEQNISAQANEIISKNTTEFEKKERFTTREEFDVIETEKIPKQMNVTPDSVWIAEYNTKFSAWGAIPILSSKLVSSVRGNEIHLKIGKKWVYWFEKPLFNAPAPDRIIKKGDVVSLAKKRSDGSWIINTGTVTEISKDTKSEYPYVKTEGWSSTEIIEPEQAEQIFVDYRKTTGIRTNESAILSFQQWVNL